MICVGFRKEGGGRHAGPIIVRPRDRGPSDAFVRLNANVRVREEALVVVESRRVLLRKSQ